MKRKKLIALSLSLVAVFIVAFSGVASAQNVKTGERVSVSAGETVDSALFMGGNTINIAGTVNGDVYCAGQNVTISGTVNGDVLCVGQTITISGQVEGNVRLASQTVIIGGSVGRSATVATQSLVVEKEGIIQRDLVGGSQSATIDGTISRDVTMGAASLVIAGQIGRDVTGEVETLSVNAPGQIRGDLRYSSNNSPSIGAGGQVEGAITRTPIERSGDNRVRSPYVMSFSSYVYVFVTMLIMALVLVLLFPSVLKETSLRALTSPGRVALTGLIGVIVAPVLIITLIISVIGLPLGILAMLVWIVMAILSGPVVGFLVGRLLLKNEKRPVVIMLLGATVLLLLYFIPILGFFVALAVYVYGIGMLLDEAIFRTTRPLKKVA